MNMRKGISACSNASTIDFWNNLRKLMDHSKNNKSMAFIPPPPNEALVLSLKKYQTQCENREVFLN
jgi:hypothetical protein